MADKPDTKEEKWPSYTMVDPRMRKIYFQFYQETYKSSAIDRKTKELIAIAASLALGFRGTPPPAALRPLALRLATLIGTAARRIDAVGEPLRQFQALLHTCCEEMTTADSALFASVFGQVLAGKQGVVEAELGQIANAPRV